MTKLDNDTASSVARPSAPAPAKGALPAQSLYDPNAHNPFAAFYDLPAVKAAMPPQKGRSDAGGASAARSAASPSPQTVRGPLEGLLHRQGSHDGPVESSVAAQPDMGYTGTAHTVKELRGKYATGGLGYDSHAAAAEVTAGQDSTGCLPSANSPGTLFHIHEAGIVLEAEQLEYEDAAELDSGGHMAIAPEPSESADEADMDTISPSERRNARQQAAGASISGRGCDAGKLPEVSLSQLDADVWSELPLEVQQQLLQGASGKRQMPPDEDSRKQVCIIFLLASSQQGLLGTYLGLRWVEAVHR